MLCWGFCRECFGNTRFMLTVFMFLRVSGPEVDPTSLVMVTYGGDWGWGGGHVGTQNLVLSSSSSSSSARASVLVGRTFFLFIAWMDPSSRQYQEMLNPSMVNMVVSTKGTEQQERKPRPQPDQALKCPRCDSTNTKFCYYNNYSLSQPRYFCKSCRRYWTKGGTLRNVPVGGGCRKNRRSSSSSKRTQDQLLTSNDNNNNNTLPPLSYDTNDLSLAFARLQKQGNNVNLGFDGNELSMLGNPSGLSFVGNHNNFQAFYNYASLGEADNVGGTVAGVSGDMMTMFPYNNNNDSEEIIDNAAMTAASDVTVATMKQGLCNNDKPSEDRSMLWNLPWQLSGDHGGYNMADLDSGRESWGGLSSSWHGLLHSPLM
ncbi:hypothetical protein V6N12_033099 [Hibiscus sabdariffa]|uniref:Dof zinc finger protein n=1 Tax=Hibiscus sabdariffa TaxID=183260 RepID=A0ABR2BCJ3_9ROSI